MICRPPFFLLFTTVLDLSLLCLTHRTEQSRATTVSLLLILFLLPFSSSFSLSLFHSLSPLVGLRIPIYDRHDWWPTPNQKNHIALTSHPDLLLARVHLPF